MPGEAAASGEKAARAEEHLGRFRDLKTQLAEVIAGQDEQAPSDLLYLERLAGAKGRLSLPLP